MNKNRGNRKNWMAALASQYRAIQERFPEDKLMIVFDIDGTIIDTRYITLYVLKAYDNFHNTAYFKNLQASHITEHEDQIEILLQKMGLADDALKSVVAWYNEFRWASEYLLKSYKPFSGVMEVIRWFQFQPNTFVGLNSGKPDFLKNDTLKSLNELGKEFKVCFTDKMLFMNPKNWDKDVPESKAAGIKYFQKKGFRVFAFIDDDPENLKAVTKIDPDHEILLLHAPNIFRNKNRRLPARIVKGKKYDITELISEDSIPHHIQLVWHGINDKFNMRQFIASEISWGEFDVRFDPIGEKLILRHDSFKDSPLAPEEKWYEFEDILKALQRAGKSIKIDLKAGGELLEKVIEEVEKGGFTEADLWFNGNIERLMEKGFRTISKIYPHAILQCPIDFCAPLISSAPKKSLDILQMLTCWGINRFSINWETENISAIFEQVANWGFEINIYNVPDLESFLRAVLLMPRSITSDFNFPKWHYYGRGSGEKGDHYEYSIKKLNKHK